MIQPRKPTDTQDVARHYDELDAFYREIWGEHLHHGLWTTGRESVDQAVLHLIDTVADAAGVREGIRVCDIGCGYGGTSRYLASSRGAHVTAYTVSETQYRYALAKGVEVGDAANPDYHLCPWEKNELSDASMDGAVSIECFTHVPDKEAYFRELHRVLKPSSYAALTVWMHRPKPRAWQVRCLIEPICYEGRLASIGSADEYRALIEASGLVIDDFQDWSDRVRKTWWVCLRRLTGRLFTSSHYRKTLLDSGFENRVFAKTLARILVAYHSGVMRYGFFRLRRPD